MRKVVDTFMSLLKTFILSRYIRMYWERRHQLTWLKHTQCHDDPIKRLKENYFEEVLGPQSSLGLMQALQFSNAVYKTDQQENCFNLHTWLLLYHRPIHFVKSNVLWTPRLETPQTMLEIPIHRGSCISVDVLLGL